MTANCWRRCTRSERSIPSSTWRRPRAAIRSTPVEDFYVVPSENREDGAVGFRILVNPLVWWMWVAGPVMIFGTVIALWPSRAPARRPVTVASPATSAAD